MRMKYSYLVYKNICYKYCSWRFTLTKEVDVIEAIIGALLGIFVGIIVGYFVRKNISEAKIGQAEKMADDIIDKANKEAETLQKEKLLEAKDLKKE